MSIDRRLPPAFVASVLSHVSILVVCVIASRILPESAANPSTTRPSQLPPDIVWTTAIGSGPGGGGGGDGSTEPVRRLERRSDDAHSIPKSRAVTAASTVPTESEPLHHLDISVVPAAQGVDELPGALVGSVAPTGSRGPGSGDGADGGDGSGIGRGIGPGLGPGVYTAGAGVTNPVLIHSIRPRYTVDAMRARLQGVVEMDAVVLPDGRVGSLRVVRSLDRAFGLDASS